MSFTVQSKSQLAKLLATENLSIEHQKIQTAMFDPKNRVLYCPIWENMSGSLYDLLMGHEVGHALHTPAEGWHDAISTRGGNFKGFLNVVEDARIEKKIKRRYPGIRSSFVEGYKSLLDRDFFGIKNRNVNSLSFIDRLNIHEKVCGTIAINFSDEEYDLVKQVESCETWADVVRVTGAIFDYSKHEQFETYQSVSMEYSFGDSDEFEFGDSDEDFDSDGQNTSEESDSGDEENCDADSTDQSSDSDADKESNKVNREKESKLCEDDFEPTCETDTNFRRNEAKLVSATCKPYIYINVPKPKLENIITPYKRVHEQLEEFYYKCDTDIKKGNQLLKKFKSKNDRYIGLLAKEFEMRKAAASYNKSKISTTGDIDIDKVYKYQIEDNIFRKMMQVSKGKSHGLVLLLDKSGSMQNNMKGSIEQIIVLCMFCRKVNIPFVVYGFGNSGEAFNADYPGKHIESCFSAGESELVARYVFLREYLNSRMSNAEFTRCIRNMISLMDSCTGYYSRLPRSEHLGNTPLIEAMIALVPITKQFRKSNNLDIVNLVVVHDGDSDYLPYYYSDCHHTQKRYYQDKANIFIREGSKTFPLNTEFDYDALRSSIFDWYAHMTDAKIFGFFIAGKKNELTTNIINRYHTKDNETIQTIVQKENPDVPFNKLPINGSKILTELSSYIKEHKFLESFNPGYNSFYIIPGGDQLNIDDDELVVSGNVTSSKLKTAFMKMNKKRQVSRVLVSRFISGIAA